MVYVIALLFSEIVHCITVMIEMNIKLLKYQSRIWTGPKHDHHYTSRCHSCWWCWDISWESDGCNGARTSSKFQWLLIIIYIYHKKFLVTTATKRNGQNPNGHKPKWPQTETATNRNGHRPERPQTGTATNRNGHRPKRPQTETATNWININRQSFNIDWWSHVNSLPFLYSF